MTRKEWEISTTARVGPPDDLIVPEGVGALDRKTIIGASGIVLVNGTMIGSLSVHFPALKDRLLLDTQQKPQRIATR